MLRALRLPCPARRTAPARQSVKLGLERLEVREVPAVNLNVGVQPMISTYEDVGFRQNVVAGLTPYVNGKVDLNTSNYTAQVRWQEGGAWEPATILLNGDGSSTRMLIKGSHTYNDLGQYRVEVKVSGPEGASVTEDTCTVVVRQLPNNFPGVEPPVLTPLMAPSNISVNIGVAPMISTYTGVGFRMNEVGSINPRINGQNDRTLSNYRVQINWGDSSQWTEGVLAPNTGGGSMPFLLKGSHTYVQAGQYRVAVYVTGPDGTTFSTDTTTIVARQMPAGVQGIEPAIVAPSREPSNVALNVSVAPMISTYAGVGFRMNQVGGLNGYLNGFKNTTLTDYHVQINWGDSSQWTEGVLAETGNGSSQSILLKGSHTYVQPGMYRVVVYVTGPDGTTTTADTTTISVSQMPNGRPGVQPPATAPVTAPANVDLNLGVMPILSVRTGQWFSALVGALNGYVNGQANRTASDYRVRINWGNTTEWTEGSVRPNIGGGSQMFHLAGTGRYLTPGQYQVVVYVTGPDGTTIANRTTTVVVSGPRIYQIDKAKFLQAYQARGTGFGDTFQTKGQLNASQLAGLSRLIDSINADPRMNDPRWMAYMMATIRHETKRPLGGLGWFETWQPVSEVGGGRGRPYGTTYFGRGYVQLTWRANYAMATQKLRANAIAWGHPEWRAFDLVRNPSLALRPDVSYFIASAGMREGWFGHYAIRNARGRVVAYGNYKLSDFFNARQTNWVGARRIINGTDRAGLIAADAQKIHRLLVQSLVQG